MTTPPAPPPSPKRLAEQERWKRANNAMLDDSLQRFTLVWLDTLPESVRPLNCARHYPRVLNRIAALWSLPERSLDHLAELLTDRRGTRQGFGHGVLQELQHLQAYRIELAPPAKPDEPDDFPPTVPIDLL